MNNQKPEQRLLYRLRINFLGRGLLNLLFGLGALFFPIITLSSLLLIFGVYAILVSALAFRLAYLSYLQKEFWQVYALESGLGLLVGFLAILFPDLSSLSLLYIVAFWSAFVGFSKIFQAVVYGKKLNQTFWLGLSGGIYLVFAGFLGFSAPEEGILALITILGLATLLNGLGLLIFSFRIKVKKLT